MSYQEIKLDQESLNSSRPRRLSLKPQDLPIFTIWKNKCCANKKSNEKMQSMLAEESQKSAQEKQSEKKLMTEQCLDATVNKIVSNLSWVNATLLAVAMKNTLEIDFSNANDKYDAANNAWIYFFVIFTLGIILAVVPRAFEDLTEMKRELNISAQKKKKLKEEPMPSLEKRKSVQIKSENTKVYDVIEVEANELIEKFEDLFVDTLSNTVSMAWRDAAKATFALTLSSASATATAYFFYALLMTCLGLYLVIRIGGVYEKKESAIQTYLDSVDSDSQDSEEIKAKLMAFAFVKRSIKLTQTVIKFAIAWSWRDCINAFIHAIYGGDSDDLVGQKWGYFFTLLCFVSIAFSFSERFYILFPKTSNAQEQQIFLNDKSRKSVNSVLYTNLKFVVGMALFDAFMTSLESISSDELSNSLLCLLYWVVSVGGISLSVIGTNYVKKWKFKNKIADHGFSQALFDTFERFYDPNEELHIEGDQDFVPMILDTSVFELIDVTVFALGIAGSMGTTNAITFTINSITSGSGLYDVSDPGEMAGHVWVVWVSFLLCLVISTLITGYFARAVNLMKQGRRELFRTFQSNDNQEMHRFSALDELESKEEESSEEKEKENVRKRNQFSTEAADEGDLGADFDADAGGGDDGDDGDGGDGGDGGDDDGGGDDMGPK